MTIIRRHLWLIHYQNRELNTDTSANFSADSVGPMGVKYWWGEFYGDAVPINAAFTPFTGVGDWLMNNDHVDTHLWRWSKKLRKIIRPKVNYQPVGIVSAAGGGGAITTAVQYGRDIQFDSFFKHWISNKRISLTYTGAAGNTLSVPEGEYLCFMHNYNPAVFTINSGPLIYYRYYFVDS